MAMLERGSLVWLDEREVVGLVIDVEVRGGAWAYDYDEEGPINPVVESGEARFRSEHLLTGTTGLFDD